MTPSPWFYLQLLVMVLMTRDVNYRVFSQFCCSFFATSASVCVFFSYCPIFPFLYLLYYLLLFCFLFQCAHLCFFYIFIFLYFSLSMLFTLFFTFLLVNIFPFQSENSSSCLRLMNLLSLGCQRHPCSLDYSVVSIHHLYW